MQSTGEEATPQRDSDLSPLSLADGALENVTKCGDCGKPVLQSAKEEHAVTCQATPEASGSQPLKRRLSEASANSSQQLKKSKLVVHLSGSAPDKAKPPGGSEKKNKRIVDVDRQCGVINEKGYPCPRSLTCKTHNMSAKRAVPGRSQAYDILLFEWQKANKANQQKIEAAKLAGQQPPPTISTARQQAAAAAAAVQTQLGGEGATTSAATAPSLTQDVSGGGMLAPAPPKPKKRKSGLSGVDGGGLTFKVPGEKKGKKGIVYVGEMEDSDDDGGADELVDSDEEVEAVLRGLSRVERGRPLWIQRGGGAGFSAASMLIGRNTKLSRLRDTLRDVFRPL
ncbi:histone acetylation-related protein [Rhodotorula toruloides]|uniref:Histone acetylation-related protein n=1 Tax=Rhodotorula toruloides TaxID=5286 RepID=A0A511KC03_RHOTO|nr:histone acetylation-related protein [Rhodotorula toruloides]